MRKRCKSVTVDETLSRMGTRQEQALIVYRLC